MSVSELDLDVAPAPYRYNPSAWSQRIPICVLAMVGFAVAFYMGSYQWGLVTTVWDPVFGEQTQNVLTSDVSHRMYAWFRVPDASFGALAYLGDAIFGLAGSTRRWQYRPWMVVIFGIDVIPLGIVSAILVMLQATIVGNWCLPCLVTAAISLVLVAMAYDEVNASLRYLWRVWGRTGSWRTLWRVFWGQPSKEAVAVALERGGV